MNIRSSLLASVASMFTFGGAAVAADLPVKAPVVKVPVAVANWTGWYAGVHAGWVGQRNCNTLESQGLWPNFPDDAAYLATLGTGCASSSGFIGGAQIGANYQIGGSVWGFEADISALTSKTSRTSAGAFPVTPANGILTESAKTEWLSTFRLRGGVLVTDNTLLYATGGLAVAKVAGDVDTTYLEFNGDLRGHATGSVSQVTPGWTIGGGVETRLGSNWSLKAEYLYVSLDPIHYNTSYDLLNGVNVWGFFTENVSFPTRLHILRVGANYRFGGDPVVSAYASSAAKPAFSWTGFYAGVNLGATWGDSRATDVNCCGAGPWHAVGDTFTAKARGATGGVQAGYNWQSGMVVAGIEADVGFLGFKGRQSSALAVGDTFATSEGGLFATVRGRLGLAVDRTLFYATGGLIVADVRSGVEDPWVSGAFTAPLSGPLTGILVTEKTKTQTGWTLGGGIEYALSNIWSIKGEYLYFDLGTARVTGVSPNADPPAVPNVAGYDMRNTGSIARFGVNARL